MIRHQAFRFRLKPTTTEAQILRQFIGCSRFVWNKLLAENALRLKRGQERLGYYGMANYLMHLKRSYPFLQNAPAVALQQTLIDLDAAYLRATDPKLRAGLPKLKKRGQGQGIRFLQRLKIRPNSVYIPKLGWIGFRNSRHITGAPKCITVSFDGSHWYVSIRTDIEVGQPIHPSLSRIGIDVGVANFASFSNGGRVPGVNAFKKDALHKASTEISKNHAIVVMEDLSIRNMTASARGTLDCPGKNVRAKSALNRRILDQGWGEFRRQLAYKLTWNGGALLLVDPRNTSRTCASCGHISRDNRLTQEKFQCLRCGHAANADVNAAINILRRAGEARIACGEPI